MKTNTPEYESIKSKLRKLQALAEGGCEGEARAAKRTIENLCRKYGITLERLCNLLGANLWQHVELKMQYNTNRPYKHGKQY